jgi:hypothetical protein
VFVTPADTNSARVAAYVRTLLLLALHHVRL